MRSSSCRIGATVRLPGVLLLSYCRNTLLDNSLATSGFLQWAADRGVGVINASPVGMGLLTEVCVCM